MAAARVVLPLCLQGLDRQQMTAAIKSAPLGRVDRKIALLRYVDRLPLPDIAAQTHYSRTAIGYRMKSIAKVFEQSNPPVFRLEHRGVSIFSLF